MFGTLRRRGAARQYIEQTREAVEVRPRRGRNAPCSRRADDRALGPPAHGAGVVEERRQLVRARDNKPARPLDEHLKPPYCGFKRVYVTLRYPLRRARELGLHDKECLLRREDVPRDAQRSDAGAAHS